MPYIENPKTRGSGIIGCIPQKGRCPNSCPDCFFQSGRSYLEPLEDNLPNMPSVEQAQNRVVRVNDGNDSNNWQDDVIEATKQYPMKFYNTAMPRNLDKFDAPVVLTVNPKDMTDDNFYKLAVIPRNLMFVRVRVNTWNIDEVVTPAVRYYTSKDIPVVLTFMSYFKQPIPEVHKCSYVWRKRTLNPYWCLASDVRVSIVDKYASNKRVYICGHRRFDVHCHLCGNCLREYFSTMERLKNEASN